MEEVLNLENAINMKNRNRMYRLTHKLRKSGGVKIDTRNRTIFYKYQAEEEKMKAKDVEILCSEFGFGRQATI